MLGFIGARRKGAQVGVALEREGNGCCCWHGSVFCNTNSDMESCSSSLSPVKQGSELEMLQKEHEKKMQKIQQLKQQIADTKISLERKKKEVPEEKMEAFRALTEQYNNMRNEYNALLAKNK
ncbi:hypothetical protein Acr_28g0014130 [Actinidia rufa]|uniref:Uncharacterized protein n=1 Tax=Actinidia rufa TaxID=165716 RepID=A0A7J0HCC5_9ERIC|nr:hypothetical protein Acr_28g0014130 [Actinidia rufa]